MKTLLLILFYIQLAFFSFAENNLMFEKANQYYQHQKYDSAIVLYQQMIEDGYCDPYLYYNAGNTYYRMNKIGMSIWCFKKALLISPNKEFQDNYDLAQKKISNNIKPIEDIFFIRWWKNLYNLMSVNQWAFSSLFLFLLALGFSFYKILKKKNFISNNIKISLFISSFIFLFLGIIKFYNKVFHHHGIIIIPNAKFEYTGQNISLDEGIEVKFVSKKNELMIVKLPDGRIGSIDSNAYKKLD